MPMKFLLGAVANGIENPTDNQVDAVANCDNDGSDDGEEKFCVRVALPKEQEDDEGSDVADDFRALFELLFKVALRFGLLCRAKFNDKVEYEEDDRRNGEDEVFCLGVFLGCCQELEDR
jgi:hypothetical protein